MQQFLLYLLFVVFTGFNLVSITAQGLPQLPPQDDLEAPLLAPEDMIPEKPLPDEAITGLGKDKNAAERKTDELDKLFAQLKQTADIQTASKISRQIQGLWAQSGSETIDLLMQWSEDAINEQNYAMALDFLDNVVMLDKSYAEGWFRRASVHVQLNDIKLAMLDLNQSLEVEPRNYNALALLGSIMEITDRSKLALKAYETALSFYPQLRRIQQRIGDILEKQTDHAT